MKGKTTRTLLAVLLCASTLATAGSGNGVLVEEPPDSPLEQALRDADREREQFEREVKEDAKRGGIRPSVQEHLCEYGDYNKAEERIDRLGHAASYFAYVHIPPDGVLNGYIVYLSHERCAASPPPSRKTGWKKALYSYPAPPYGRGDVVACWREYENDAAHLSICDVDPCNRVKTNACEPASKSVFRDASSLPRRARF